MTSFWELVDAGEMPEVSDEPETRSALRDMFPKDSGQHVDLPPLADLWSDRIHEAASEIKERTSQKEYAENQLIAALGVATYGWLTDGTYWSFKADKRGHRRLYHHRKKG